MTVVQDVLLKLFSTIVQLSVFVLFCFVFLAIILLHTGMPNIWPT